MLRLADAESSTQFVPLPLREVYRQHAAFVWRVLRAFGVREADLDDMLHEVFIVVHRKLPTFEGRSKYTTWLFAIAERLASDYRRSARIRREDIVEDTESNASPGDCEPEAYDQIAMRQARVQLDAILDGMPTEQRVAFTLFEIDGMTSEEIAVITACSPNTVRSRVRLARKYFERTMAERRQKGWP